MMTNTTRLETKTTNKEEKLRTLMANANTMPTPLKFAELAAGTALTAQDYKWVGDEGIACDEYYLNHTVYLIWEAYPALCVAYIQDVIKALPVYEAAYDRDARLAYEKDDADRDPMERAYAIQGHLHNRI